MKKYAVIDIETTGGQVIKDRITEIAIVLYDGEKIIDEFESMINPERSIPYNITKLTGISNEMVQDAPKFYEVAKRIVEITEGAIFVAHNVSFDYKFIKEEFSRLGYVFTRKQLCTVRLSRQAFPGHRSYSLDNLIKRHNIPMDDRHRAMPDAKAALFMLKEALKKKENDEGVETLVNRGVKASRLPPNITLEQLHSFPEACGVYYFHNKNGDAIYVGKSINIKKRLLDHFANNTARAMRMIQEVHDISYELTGSELVALLYESDEIKKLRPIHNRAQKRTKFPYGIYHYENEKGYICFNIAKETSKYDLIAKYEKSRIATVALRSLASRYKLCRTFCNIESIKSSSCLNYQLGLCEGACAGFEAVAEYNEKALRAIEKMKLDFDKNFFLIENGRTQGEQAVIQVESGSYRGFGYIAQDDVTHISDYEECIKPYINNPDTSRIIKQYLKTKKDFKVIEY